LQRVERVEHEREPRRRSVIEDRRIEDEQSNRFVRGCGRDSSVIVEPEITAMPVQIHTTGLAYTHLNSRVSGSFAGFVSSDNPRPVV
jgi:hypothetical protein